MARASSHLTRSCDVNHVTVFSATVSPIGETKDKFNKLAQQYCGRREFNRFVTVKVAIITQYTLYTIQYTLYIQYTRIYYTVYSVTTV